MHRILYSQHACFHLSVEPGLNASLNDALLSEDPFFFFYAKKNKFLFYLVTQDYFLTQLLLGPDFGFHMDTSL